MSYSTRRSGGYNSQQQQSPQQNVGGIGQRRPVVTNNFVPGGQAKPAAPQQAAQQAPRPPQPQQTQQQASQIQFRNQNQAQQPPVKQQQQAQAVAAQAAAAQAAAAQAAAAQAAAAQAAAAQAAKEQAAQQTAAAQQAVQQLSLKQDPMADNGEDVSMETGEVRKKPFWSRTGGFKITKKEKVRRRNVRLSRMLQPKNAVMILNELVKNTSYLVEELPVRTDDGNQFKATVLYEGIEHVGYGRSKITAKNTAAEAALKHYVKTNRLTEVKKDDEGNEKMDVAEEEGSQSPLPWQHISSFALYKLFSSWGEDPNIAKSQSQFGAPDIKQECKPAKKLPENPELINPLMLINQMLPQAHFEEIGKTGNPPKVIFSFRCNCDGQSFIGTGANKKAAKKMAAFGACSKILAIQYPSDVYVPSY